MPPKAAPAKAAAVTGDPSGDPVKVTKQHIQLCERILKQCSNVDFARARDKLNPSAKKKDRDKDPSPGLPRVLVARATACCYLLEHEALENGNGEQQKKLAALQGAVDATEPVASESLVAAFLGAVAKLHLARSKRERDTLRAVKDAFVEACEKPPGLRREVADGTLLHQERVFLKLPLPLKLSSGELVDPVDKVMVWHLSTALSACVTRSAVLVSSGPARVRRS